MTALAPASNNAGALPFSVARVPRRATLSIGGHYAMLYQNRFHRSLYDAECDVLGLCEFENPTPAETTAELREAGLTNARHPADWPHSNPAAIAAAVERADTVGAGCW